MNKKDLVAKVAEQTGLTLADATKSINAVFHSVREGVVAGDTVKIKGFGTFSVSYHMERRGINPTTKQPIRIAACKVMKFKPSKSVEIK